jgi:hypothetical protein
MPLPASVASHQPDIPTSAAGRFQRLPVSHIVSQEVQALLSHRRLFVAICRYLTRYDLSQQELESTLGHLFPRLTLGNQLRHFQIPLLHRARSLAGCSSSARRNPLTARRSEICCPLIVISYPRKFGFWKGLFPEGKTVVSEGFPEVDRRLPRETTNPSKTQISEVRNVLFIPVLGFCFFGFLCFGPYFPRENKGQYFSPLFSRQKIKTLSHRWEPG